MSVSVQDHLRAGALDKAVESLTQTVKASPTDINARAALAELLCVEGNLERADTLLTAIDTIDPTAALGTALFRQLIRAEQARRQFYSDGRVPEFLKRPEGAIELELRAAVALREGAGAEAARLLAEAEETRPRAPGTIDGVPFDDFRDLDDSCSAHLEVLTSTGKYYWVPVADVVSIEFRPPEHRRDLLWRRALLSVHEGPDGEVFLPAIYASPGVTLEARHKLGHVTEFEEVGGALLGVGLRSFLVGEDSRTILEITTLEFGTAG